MLIELWERFRGYDRWIQAEATIMSSEMEDHEYRPSRAPVTHEYDSRDMLTWIDGQGNRQTGICRVPDDSPLYQLIGGEKVAIRYNPDKPEDYYFPELLKARLHHNSLRVGATVLFLALAGIVTLVFFHAYK